MGKAAMLTVLAIAAVGTFYYLIFTQVYGFTVTSWFRLPGKNESVGGKLFSLHQIGLAWDIVPNDAGTQAQLVASGLPMKIVPESDHIHVQIA
ncbi:MAG: hypothetical protein KGL39_39505 [Patescibacteria group bacterium]|nr:hypothetical protein [Patescibacteria group bacterium]